MSALLDAIAREVLSAPLWLVLLVVGVVVFVEDAIFVGFVVPGETVAILGGVAASLGHVPLAAVLVVVIAAAIVGDTVGFEVGRHLGGRVVQLRALERHRDRIDRAQVSLRRRGGTAVFLGRWTAFLRAVTPALAGMSKMHYPTFLAWNAAGGIAWGAVVVTAGYLAGRSYARVETWLGRGAAAVVVLVVVAGLVVWQVRRHRTEGAALPVTGGTETTDGGGTSTIGDAPVSAVSAARPATTESTDSTGGIDGTGSTNGTARSGSTNGTGGTDGTDGDVVSPSPSAG